MAVVNEVRPLQPFAPSALPGDTYLSPKPALREAYSFADKLPSTERGLFDLNNNTKRVGNALTKTITTSFEIKFKELDAIRKEQLKKIEERAKYEATSGFCSYLQGVASYVLAAINFVTSLFTTSQNAVALTLSLVGIGTSYLMNVLLSEAGGWDWFINKLGIEDKEKTAYLRTLLPAIVFLLIFGINIQAGSVLWNQVNGRERIMALLGFIARLTGASATILGGVTQAKMQWSEADLIKLRTQTDLIQNGVNRDTQRLLQNFDTFRHLGKEMSRLVRTYFMDMMDKLAAQKN